VKQEQTQDEKLVKELDNWKPSVKKMNTEAAVAPPAQQAAVPPAKTATKK